MKKRMVAIGMCLALSMGMLAGCGSSEKVQKHLRQ